MNEWPENLTGLDLNWNLFETANRAAKVILMLLVLVTGIGPGTGRRVAHRAGYRDSGID
jgi:hypothetical protein